MPVTTQSQVLSMAAPVPSHHALPCNHTYYHPFALAWRPHLTVQYEACQRFLINPVQTIQYGQT